MLDVVKLRNLPNNFCQGFREPSNEDHKEVVRVVAKEIVRKTDISSFRLMVWIVGTFYCVYFFEFDRAVLSVLSAGIIAITAIDIIMYLAKRCLWYSILKHISYKDYSVNMTRCYTPVINGFRSTVVVKFDGENSIVVPSLYVPTEEMLNRGDPYSNSLFVSVGSRNKVLIIPTGVVYEYV